MFRSMEQDDEDSSLAIDPDGDVELVVRCDAAGQSVRYRVSTSKLSAASPYFRSLFDPTKFREGQILAKQLETKLGPRSNGLVNRLPIVDMSDEALPLKQTQRFVFDYFLSCMHEPSAMRSLEGWSFSSIWLLAVVADRFLARKAISSAMQTIRRSAKFSPRGNRKAKGDLPERTCRQRLIIGVWFDFADWVSYFCWRLILQGSVKWIERFDEESEEDDLDLTDIPEGLEEELKTRRVCILNTLAKLQDTLLQRYLGKERVCKSGLDSSLQCDRFQLGQALRFLDRKQLVSLRSTLSSAEPKATDQESVLKLCAALMECPSYQLDPFHQNCGIRSQLVRYVEVVQQLVSAEGHVGVCLSCWRENRHYCSWASFSSTKPGKGDARPQDGHHDHRSAEAMVLAKDSIVERYEAGWRPAVWQYRWMHERDKTDGAKSENII